MDKSYDELVKRLQTGHDSQCAMSYGMHEHCCDCSYTDRAEAANSIDALRHDIARHVQIAAEQAEEIERLRTEITEAEQERDRHFSARGRLVGERDQLKADLAAARALLLEARGWLDPWESRQSALRDRIDAALAGEKK